MKLLHKADESLFWYWITERHNIWLRRQAGQAKPWTSDPILRDYKFTNVFRQLDAGTFWLTEHFIGPHWHDDTALMLFNIAWYRMFNWIGTGELLGWRTSWRSKSIRKKLTKAHDAGEQVFTGAHIVWGEFGKSKVEGVMDCCDKVWARKAYLASMSRFHRSLQQTFLELKQIRGIGPFIAYEIVTDLRHTRLLHDARDINSWANVGPGAMRGLCRMYPKIKPAEALSSMRALLSQSRSEITRPLPDSVPELELRDIEHSLCEFDKYCRVKFGEGRPRSTYNGKADV